MSYRSPDTAAIAAEVAGAVSEEFAATDHTHAGYAGADHGHEGYADDEHEHPEYSGTGHGHAGYAADDHNHAGVYSAAAHNHDADYSQSAHNHDAAYSAIDHEHAGGAVDLKPYVARDTAGNQTIGASPVTINLDHETVDNDAYSLAADTITVPAGTYLISYAVIYDITSTAGGTRGSADAWIANGGTPIAQSYSRDYHREASGGSACQSSFVAVFAAEATLTLVADINYSNTAIDTVPGRSQVSLVKLA